ncbi:hypothetical protein ACET3Z_008049 [Daucus carota]
MKNNIGYYYIAVSLTALFLVLSAFIEFRCINSAIVDREKYSSAELICGEEAKMRTLLYSLNSRRSMCFICIAQ